MFPLEKYLKLNQLKYVSSVEWKVAEDRVVFDCKRLLLLDETCFYYTIMLEKLQGFGL